MRSIKTFFSEMVIELKRVVWPTPEKIAENTRIVVVSTIIVSLFFGFVDFILVAGATWIF